MFIHGIDWKEFSKERMSKDEEKILLKRSSKTFLDIPVKVRKEKINNYRAQDLKSSLPSDIWKDLMAIYFGKGCESKEGKRVFNYLMENSEISPKVADRPSDAEPFQFLYRFDHPNTPVDEYYVRSLSATAIHLRMLSLEDNLPGIIRRELVNQELNNGEKFLILDVGAGPGDAIRKALRKKHHRDLLDKVEVHCVDSDERSVNRGKKLVERDSLSGTIKFFNKEMVEYFKENTRQNNLVLVIGLLCPMPNISCTKILSSLYKHSAPGGKIIYSTVQEEMIWGDPFLDVFMRVLGWHMHFKTEFEADFIGEKGHWNISDYFYDLLNYNRMTIAHRL
jgi:hypothetical protein